MRRLYLDIFSGVSGDMFLGALLDLGVPLEHVERELEKLGIGGYHLEAARGSRSQIAGTRFMVGLEGEAWALRDAYGAAHERPEPSHGHAHGAHGPHPHPHESTGNSRSSGAGRSKTGWARGRDSDHGHDHAHDDDHDHGHSHGRTFMEIRRLIDSSNLSEWVRRRAVAVFERIASAEGKIHGKPPEEVHFHEVGALDSIIDIVGGVIALELLGRPEVWVGPVVDGTGWIDCAHGRYPIPAPATLEILGRRGIAVTQCEEPHELVTPTGAALVAEFAERVGPMQGLMAQTVGYGLGSRETVTRPNVLRAILSETPSPDGPPHDWESDVVTILETNLDDTTAEVMAHVTGKLMSAGALDAYITPVQMKKGRPGVVLTVLAPADSADGLTAVILRETTAFGVRRWEAGRRKLRRAEQTVPTSLGEVRVKTGWLDGQRLQATPEYESCRQLAETQGVPLKRVYEAALQSFAELPARSVDDA